MVTGAKFGEFFASLHSADVTGLWPALALGDFEFNPLAFPVQLCQCVVTQV